VAILLAEARVIYGTWVEADLPVDLALSLRDKKPFDKLSDTAIEGVCRVVGIMRRLTREAREAAREAETPAPALRDAAKGKNGSRTVKTAPAPAAGEVPEKTT
jgi:hypothetical protein